MMKTITDIELDCLLTLAQQRRLQKERIRRRVMRNVSSEMRRKTLYKWAKILGTSFAVPTLTVLYIYMIFLCLPTMQLSSNIVCYGLPIVSMLMIVGWRLHEFSPNA